MFGICLRYAGNYDDAQDIVQDGFVKIFMKIGQFRFEGSFEGWMRRIMVNTALEKYRMQCQIININDYTKEIDTVSPSDLSGEISAKELVQFVQELSPRYRMVFNLYAIEGYSHKEIGNMLDISEGTSKSNLSRARAILQEKVRKYFSQSAKIK
ncbi:MAG: RNA polymerase sigma factor [Bacteroidales bacterium]|nr:RNA polymerase sigma factor [Bacteroidales bacterium]